MKCALIGSNGGLTGIYLAKNLKEIDDLILFGADTSEENGGKYFVSQQFILPKADDESFIDELIKILNTYEIDYYFPTHSHEIVKVSKYEKIIRKRSCARFIVSPIETYRALEKKDVCCKNLSNIGVPVPQLITGYNHSYPVFMKKKIGSGSSGSCIIRTEELQKAYEHEDGNNTFFEYIEGTEYTCDCLFDFKGTLIGAYERKRIKTIGGAVSITESSDKNIGLPYIQKIVSSWKMCGSVNFQYIERGDVPYFTDVNLRYPSGGLPLTVAAGIDIPKLVLRLLDGEAVAPIKINENKLRMYRYFEEIFEKFL